MQLPYYSCAVLNPSLQQLLANIILLYALLFSVKDTVKVGIYLLYNLISLILKAHSLKSSDQCQYSREIFLP